MQKKQNSAIFSRSPELSQSPESNRSPELRRSSELLNRKFVEYLAPTLLMNVSLALTNVANAAIVGRLLGSDALAAVNLCMPAFSLANAVFNTVVMGACTLIVAEKGRMNAASADRIFTQFAILGMGIMLAISLFILLFLQPLSFIFMGGVDNPDVRATVVAYLFPLAFSFPFVFIALGGSMTLRTDGRPRYGALVVLVANVVNLVAAFLLIYVFRTDAAGAAWATAIGFAFGSLLALRYFFFPSRTLRFCWLGKDLFRGFLNVVMTGLPSGSTSLLVFARVLLLNTLVFRLFGIGGEAAFAVCVSSQYFANMFLLGVTGAMQPISAMLFGEKDRSGLKIMARTALGAAVSMTTVFAILFFSAPDFIGDIFGLTGPGRDFLPVALGSLALSLPFCAVDYFYLTYCQTIRRLALGLIISFASSFGWIAILAPLFYLIFPRYFWFILPVAEILTALTLVVGIAFLRSRKKVSWLLIRKETLPTLELSIRRGDSLSSLPERLTRFCDENGFDSVRARTLVQVVHETADSISRRSVGNPRRVLFDLVVKIEREEAIVHFCISGNGDVLFDDPNALDESEIGRSLRLASDVRVMQTLGFNVIFFKI